MGRAHRTGCAPNTAQARQVLISCLIVAVWFQEILRKYEKNIKAKKQLMLFQLHLIHDWSSDTVITSPPNCCYEHRRINKHNKYCQKKKEEKRQKTTPDKLKALNYMAVSAWTRALCVRPPCDSLDELEIYNTGFYSTPRPKSEILPPLLAL